MILSTEMHFCLKSLVLKIFINSNNVLIAGAAFLYERSWSEIPAA